MKKIGEILHYYPKIEVAIIELKESLKVGDKIMIKGSITNFEQIVESMQIEHEDVQFAEARKLIGLKVVGKVRGKDTVYKID